MSRIESLKSKIDCNKREVFEIQRSNRTPEMKDKLIKSKMGVHARLKDELSKEQIKGWINK